MTCTYCFGAGRVIGGRMLTYLWWRLTGRCLKQCCPECGGTGQMSYEEGAVR